MNGFTQFAVLLAAVGVGFGNLIYIVGRLSGNIKGLDHRLERIENTLNGKGYDR